MTMYCCRPFAPPRAGLIALTLALAFAIPASATISPTLLAAPATGHVGASLAAVAAPTGTARAIAPVVRVPAGQGTSVRAVALALPANSLYRPFNF